MIRAIFFDFDGTISDTRDIAARILMRTLKEFGYKFEEKKIMDLLGIKMKEILEILGFGRVLRKKISNRFYKKFTAEAKSGNIKPCVSLRPLWKLREEGVRMFVISNSRRSFLKLSIRELGVGKLFGQVYGAEDFDEKDEMIGKLVGKLRVEPSEVIYVGDRFSDVEAAKEAGCVSVAIHNTCSFSTRGEIVRVGPDFLVRDFRGLRRVVGEIGKGKIKPRTTRTCADKKFETM